MKLLSPQESGSAFNARPEIDKESFDEVRRLVYDLTGIALSDRKDVLVSARVSKRMRELGMREFRDYLDHVLADESGDELTVMLDALCTNVTSFFRESDHFDILADHFRQWQDQGQRVFRFWSAACSTGEEPYSMAMTLLENTLTPDVDAKVLATDLSTKALRRSREGVYERRKLADVESPLVEKYLAPLPGGDDLVVPRDLKRMVVFARINLSTPPFPMSGPFDAVFCRNVMIYFDNEGRRRLLRELERLVRPGGLLMLGHAESMTGVQSSMRAVAPSVYRKP